MWSLVWSRLAGVDGVRMTWLMLPLALALVGIARVGMWLFPEDTNAPKHYEGDFGQSDNILKSWDELSKAEKESLWDM
jgi:hypothetical protein